MTVNVIRERGLSEHPRFGGRHRKDFVVLDGDKLSRLAAFVENPGEWLDAGSTMAEPRTL
jgi:hypothetical protein